MSEKQTPSNLNVTWTRSSKSFGEVYSKPIHNGLPNHHVRQHEWVEAEAGKQLDESVFSLLFHKALALARRSPQRAVTFLRADHDSMPVNDNNRPFTPSDSQKTTIIEGHVFTSDMSRPKTYGKTKPNRH